MPKKRNQMLPVHPGEILREDVIKSLGLTVNGLARELRVPVNRLSEIVNGRRAVNADVALRLSRYFGNTPEFWINLQAAYDLRVTIHSSANRTRPAYVYAPGRDFLNCEQKGA
jgi:antitoxin HigA-1